MLRARHILSTTGATLVSGGLVLGLTLLIARALTPEQNGYYAQYVLVFNLVYIGLNFGLGPSSTFFIASRRATVRSVWTVNLAMLAVVACLLSVATWFIHQREMTESLRRLLKIPAPALYLGLLAGMLLLSFNQVVAVLMGEHRYDLVNALNVLRALSPFLLVGGAVLVGASSFTAITLGQTVAMAIALALAVSLARRATPEGAPAPMADFSKDLRSMLSYGSLVYLSNLLHYLAMRGLLLLLSYWSAPESVGFLNLALLLLEVTLLLPSAIGQLVFPQSSTAGFDHALLETVLRVNLYVSVAVVVLILVLARPLVTLLIGPAYLPVALALIHLTPSVVLLAVPRILSQLLSGQGHPRYPLAAAALSLTLGAAVAAWVIPRWGYLGAAWVTNLVSAITAAVTLFGYCQVHRVRLAQVLLPRERDWLSVQRLAMKLAGR